MIYSDFKETSCSMLNADDYAVVYSSETKWINRMRKLAEKHPNEVRIVERSGDAVDAYIPKSWFKITPPRKVSETQREKAAERLKTARNNKKNMKRDET